LEKDLSYPSFRKRKVLDLLESLGGYTGVKSEKKVEEEV